MGVFSEIGAGSLAGVAEITCSHPLDYLKTKHQEHVQLRRNVLHPPTIDSHKSNSTFQPIQFLKQTWRERGIRGIYTGFVPRLMGIIPMRAVYWGSMSITDTQLDQHKIIGMTKTLMMGGIVGGCQTLVDNPIEVMKIQSMTQNHKSVNNQQRFHFTGFVPTMLRNIGFATVMGVGYQYRDPELPLHNFGICGLSAIIGSIVTQPLDYVKTEAHRIKTNSPSLKGKPGHWQRAGVVAISNPSMLFSGGLARMCLSTINMAVGGFVFIQLLNHLPQEKV